MTKCDVLIIGAGPAGLGAAQTAAQAGAAVLIVDESSEPGGQYLRPSLKSDEGTMSPSAGLRSSLLDSLEDHGVSVRVGSTVWGVFDGVYAIFRESDSDVELITPKTVVLATGGYDRPVPMSGWTLPGVFTAGAAQALAKQHGVTIGQRPLISGSGPFLLPVAQNLIKLGIRPVSILEATGFRDWLPHLVGTLAVKSYYREALGYLRSIRAAGVPIRTRMRVKRIVGSERVEAAHICQVDREWREVPNTEEVVEVDSVAMGFGFTPAIELAEHIGCEVLRNEHGDYWYVATNERMETSVPTVYAAGETTGVGGADLALVEGRLAGAGAAQRAGFSSVPVNDQLRRLVRQRHRLTRWSRTLDNLFGPKPGLFEGLDEESVVCRCEEVTYGQIRESIASGCTTPKEVKDWTRAQMGLCQGRMCGQSVARVLAGDLDIDVGSVARPSVRPPIKPVPISALAKMEPDSAEPESL